MNCFPIGMEYFNAEDDTQWNIIKNLIKGDKGQVPVTGYLSPRLPESLNQPSANACKSL